MNGWIRDPEDFGGGISLSVQASAYHYCSPRVTGLPLLEYKSVEVALTQDGNLRRPEGLLSPDLCHLFDDGEVTMAGYVSQEDVERMREQLRHG